MATPTDNSLTLANFILAIREQSDTVDLETRHSDALLVRMINQTWRQLRTKLTNAGWDYFLLGTTPTALPTSAAETDEQYIQVDWPTGAAKIFGVDVLLNSTWIPVDRGTWQERRDYQHTVGTLLAGATRTPMTYVIKTLPVENDASALTAGKIALFPLDLRGNDYRVWYLPYWVDIAAANTTYLFFGHDDWFQWAIYDVTWKIYVRDNEETGVLDRVAKARDDIWADIVRSVQKINATPAPRVRMRRRRRGVW